MHVQSSHVFTVMDGTSAYVCLTFNLVIATNFTAVSNGPPLPVNSLLFLPVTATLCIRGLQTTERHVTETDSRKKNIDGVTSHVLGGKKLTCETFCPDLKIQLLDVVNMLNRLSLTVIQS